MEAVDTVTLGVVQFACAEGAALAKAGKKTEARTELQAALGGSPPPRPSRELDQLKAELGL